MEPLGSMMARASCALVLALSLGAAAAARAQTIAAADSLLRAGRVADAESWYYGMSDAHPRDPVARAALGRFLGERGALRVGAVLLEEARQFGGDPVRIARDLAPLYRALGDYRALATLPGSPLTPAERSQAVWLVSHQPSVAAPESLTVSLRARRDRTTIAVVRVRVDDVPLDAALDPRARGIVLDTAWRARAAVLFGGGRTSAPLGAVGSVRIGELALGNVPVSFAVVGAKRAVIGLDVIARFAPTVDVATGRLVLRSSGELPPRYAGTRLPTLTDAQGMRVLLGGQFVSLESALADSLRGASWTVDAARGALVVAK